MLNSVSCRAGEYINDKYINDIYTNIQQIYTN